MTADDAPTLLVAGNRDFLVPVKHSRNIYAAFQDTNVESRLVVLEGVGHIFPKEHLARANDELAAWFQKHLVQR